jgi:signal transduction histidine kinase
MSATAEVKPRVLYVDDDRSNRVVFEQSLSEFNVITADGGDRALELIDDDVAILVTDMRMPGMSGEELLRVVKERHPQVIRMVVTAHKDINPILRAINEGLVARYIIKPWERAELVQILRWGCEAWSFSRDSAALHRRLLETERLATLGSIAALLVHDLRQPLMSLLVNIEHLQDLSKHLPALQTALESAIVPPNVRERLTQLTNDLKPTTEDLQSATLHLSNLIDGLRDLGRPNAPATHTIDPVPIVRHAMAVCQELATKTRASIGYEGPQLLPRVRISATELMQVLINLVANATQAIAARGLPNGQVSITAQATGGMLELQVRDTGVGMTRDTLERVGTPFFTTRPEGTGLGIAQCQRLIGNSGGRFKIDSEHGVGTTVTIVLPTAVA